MLDRNITSKLRVFDPSISTFIRLYHTKTKLPRTIQPSRCVPVFLLVLSYQIKQNPQTWKVWGGSNCPYGQSSLFVRGLISEAPSRRGSCVWLKDCYIPPALAANQARVPAVTELASPENCFYCKWEPTKLQGKIFDKAARRLGRNVQMKAAVLLASGV